MYLTKFTLKSGVLFVKISNNAKTCDFFQKLPLKFNN